MANIDRELQAIQDAIYGEEVRGAIHDGIKAVNDSATDSARVAETKAAEAQQMAQEASAKATEANEQAILASGKAADAQASAETAEYWAEKAEQAVNLKWGGVEEKPFETLNPNQFESVNGALTSKLKANDIMTDTEDSIQKILDELSSFESITYKGTVDLIADLPTNAENGWMYYCKEDQKHYVCVNDPEIDLYEWHEYHTFDDNYLITVEKVKNDLETQDAGYVLDARQGYELKQDLTHLQEKYAVVQGTTSSATVARIVDVNYPNGFNQNNCVIVSSMTFVAGSVWQEANNSALAQLSTNSVRYYTDGTELYRSVPFKVVLMKI